MTTHRSHRRHESEEAGGDTIKEKKEPTRSIELTERQIKRVKTAIIKWKGDLPFNAQDAIDDANGVLEAIGVKVEQPKKTVVGKPHDVPKDKEDEGKAD
jgi:hypothetical protein